MTRLPDSRSDILAFRRSGRALIVVARAIPVLLTLTLLAACASTPPPSSGTLTSYADLAQTKGRRTQASTRAESAPLMAARTVRIAPVTFAGDAQSNATPAQLALIANAMERTLCKDLSARFDIVTGSDMADLTVRTAITRIKPTNAAAAALSRAVSLAVPAPRLPVGLGGFAAEAEAMGPQGNQVAAMIWSRDADLSGAGRASSIGDAYELSAKFAHDLARLMVPGKDRAARKPRGRDEPVNAACALYGAGPGLSGVVAGLFGAPPEWTDRPRPGL
ncbi:MAG: DUF3313 domain-containing protein [Alphaproteobacteria bacterium]|nr:DUF3313 domain-containing protein [Alphaproteobacteria bacterium]